MGATVKAMLQREPKAPLEWTDVPDPVAGHDEVVAALGSGA